MDSDSGSMQLGTLNRGKSEVDWADIAQRWIGTRQQYDSLSDPAFLPAPLAENRPSASSLPRVYNSVSDVVSYSYSPTKTNSYSGGAPVGGAPLYPGHAALLPTPSPVRMTNCVRPVRAPFEPCMSGIPPVRAPNRCMSPRMARLGMPPPPGRFPVENFGPMPHGPQAAHWPPPALGNTMQYPMQCNVDRWCPPVAPWPATINPFDRQEPVYEPRALSNAGLPTHFPMQRAVDPSGSMPAPVPLSCSLNEPPSFNYHAWGHPIYPAGSVSASVTNGAGLAGSGAMNVMTTEQRKSLPNWIRDGLEKIEQEKRKSTEGSSVNVEVHSDTGEPEEEEEKASRDSSSRSEAETQQLLRTLQKQLTAVLLEVTNSEVEAICETKFKEEKGKAQPKLLAQSTALASILHLGDDEDEQECSSEEGASDGQPSERTKRPSPTFRAPLPPPSPSRSKSTGGSRSWKSEDWKAGDVPSSVTSTFIEASNGSQKEHESFSRYKGRSDANHRSSSSLKHHRSPRNGLDEEVYGGHTPKMARKLFQT